MPPSYKLVYKPHEYCRIRMNDRYISYYHSSWSYFIQLSYLEDSAAKKSWDVMGLKGLRLELTHGKKLWEHGKQYNWLVV